MRPSTAHHDPVLAALGDRFGWLALDFVNTQTTSPRGVSDVLGTPESFERWALAVGVPAAHSLLPSSLPGRRTLLVEAVHLRRAIREALARNAARAGDHHAAASWLGTMDQGSEDLAVESAFRFTAVVVWCLEAGVGNGMRVPEHALPMTCAALALVLLAVFAARRAARWVRSKMMQRRSSSRDLTCRFSIGGRWVSLPASARVVDLKTALLKAAVGDAKPPDGAEEVTAAKSWVLASNGKALKNSKTLLVIPLI